MEKPSPLPTPPPNPHSFKNWVLSLKLCKQSLLKIYFSKANLQLLSFPFLFLLFQMRIHSPSPHKLAQSKSSDYFFNYFTLGIVSNTT